ncbi:hypothetical protein IWQ60_009469 [Tieghemiomyces parasiticus]|uniref:V-type proton ATPase subunit G n=1 Tax=Tieghemiomyces parasiticus TaxID=78921 RepID=A0A9W7ZMX8_9FUNG|nr:hypothetical protein IWQ60_009469 [Tieghemiomyces parasiticus]
MSNNQGIQTLLEAEKEAAKTVERARQYRVQKLKEARSEAAKEIEELKAQKTAELAHYESEHSGSNGQLAEDIEADTQHKISELERAFASHQEEVIQKLLATVTQVEPKVHPNVRKVE